MRNSISSLTSKTSHDMWVSLGPVFPAESFGVVALAVFEAEGKVSSGSANNISQRSSPWPTLLLAAAHIALPSFSEMLTSVLIPD